MILIPELQTVMILVPRTGTGSLRKAVANRYPQSHMIYRHMEACGVPRGYEFWRRVGIVRHPLDRLWSLYKFMRTYRSEAYDSAYAASLKNSTKMEFSDWIMHNEVVFTSPYDRSGRGRFNVLFTNNHPIPENHKSQFLYLRPDLGTDVIRFDDLPEFAATLDLSLGHDHQTEGPMPEISTKAWDHIGRVFAWDLDQVL